MLFDWLILGRKNPEENGGSIYIEFTKGGVIRTINNDKSGKIVAVDKEGNIVIAAERSRIDADL